MKAEYVTFLRQAVVNDVRHQIRNHLIESPELPFKLIASGVGGR
jgi:hypothetical protein